ncbi:MAG TPA: hypothetical protein VGV85_00050, partial [Longimicrobiaceae bacterium]|nr:hypothetical protein [Longimicrobiaceae bacterium]
MRVRVGPGVLVVRDAAVGLRALGLVMLATGAAMLASGGAVAGALLAAGGLLLAVGPRVHTAVFDLAAGTLLLRSHGSEVWSRPGNRSGVSVHIPAPGAPARACGESVTGKGACCFVHLDDRRPSCGCST